MEELSSVALTLIGIFVLYCVIRLAVRDGIRAARELERSQKAAIPANED